MYTVQRRLRSIAHQLIESEISFAHGIESNMLGALEPSSKSSSYPVIIGGMVLDIVARPDAHPYPGTTTPGKVEYLSGGVARNIVECMTKLGSKPFMISVVGFDIAGVLLLKLWESAGLPTEGILKLKNITTPIVSNIFDSKGEIFAGVASVGAVEKFLSPDWISKFRHHIYSAPILMVDANLHPDSLEAACRTASEFGTPVWFEPVSVAKSARIASVIHHVACTSPNENELIAMANALSVRRNFSSVRRDASTEKSPPSVRSLFNHLQPAICLLMGKGIKLLVITLGPDGVFVCFRNAAELPESINKNKDAVHHSRELYELVNHHCPPQHEGLLKLEKMNYSAYDYHAFHLPSPAVSVVASRTGAGDCLVGGMLSSLCSGLDIMRSAAVGVAMAKAAVEAPSNLPAEISPIRITSEARLILLGSTHLL